MIQHFVPKVVSLRNHPGLGEGWLQERIAEDPSILGLGDLILKDKERSQPAGGRLDILLQDPESYRRYEVEIQLGETDPSHIIRTIEYWDVERRRYPQYDHCAVIVAEDITSRFLNVIGLFNGHIPLIALKMQAIELEGRIGLLFTRVLDELPLGLIEEDEETQEVTDRAFWEEERATPRTVAIADDLLDLIHEFAPQFELKYNKYYIGLAEHGQANNFVAFRPRKSSITLELKIPRSEETSEALENGGLEVIRYDPKWQRYLVRLSHGDVEKNEDLLRRLMKESHDARV